MKQQHINVFYLTTGVYLGLFVAGIATDNHTQWLLSGLGIAINGFVALYHAEFSGDPDDE